MRRCLKVWPTVKLPWYEHTGFILRTPTKQTWDHPFYGPERRDFCHAVRLNLQPKNDSYAPILAWEQRDFHCVTVETLCNGYIDFHKTLNKKGRPGF